MFIIKSLIFRVVLLAGAFGSIEEKNFTPMELDPQYRVDKVATPLSEKQLNDVLCVSYVSKYKKVPNKKRLSMAWAHISLENARGKKVWNNNLGNQGPFSMKQKYYHHLRRGWPYRSFESPGESAEAYWRILEKCQLAFNAFSYGDAATAALSLKRCNYYSSPVEGYTKNLNSLYHEAISKFAEPCGKKED